jgi:transposase
LILQTVFVAANRKYPVELRARAVRLYRESVSGVDPKPVIRRLAEQLNVHPEALRNCIRQAEADRGERGDRPTEMIAENRLLVNEVLGAASVYFAAEIGQTRRSS